MSARPGPPGEAEATAEAEVGLAGGASDVLELADDERGLVGEELVPLLAALTGDRLDRYRELAAAVEAGTVPAELVPQLESLLELALQTARARQLYRAEGERVLTGLFRRTPRGRQLAEHVEAVNGALRALGGHRLKSIRAGMRTVGHFTLTIATEEATITMGFRPDGLGIESVGVGEAGGKS